MTVEVGVELRGLTDRVRTEVKNAVAGSAFERGSAETAAQPGR